MTEQKYTFDLGQITISEYRELFKKETKAEREDEIMGKCAGLTNDEIGQFSLPEWRVFVRAFYAEIQKPADADPN